jgi:hypothetical protein
MFELVIDDTGGQESGVVKLSLEDQVEKSPPPQFARI